MSTIDPNDPRLTDYVLGELDSAERAEIEQLLERSPAARAAVDELLEVSGLLAESLKSAPAPALTIDQRAAIDAAVQNAPKVAAVPTKRRPIFRTTATLATVAVSAAALWMVVIVLHRAPNADMTRDIARAKNDDGTVANRGDTATGTHQLPADGDGVFVPMSAISISSDGSFVQNESSQPQDGEQSQNFLDRRDGRVVSFGESQKGQAVAAPSVPPPPVDGATPQVPSNFLVLPAQESWPKHGTIVGLSAPDTYTSDFDKVQSSLYSTGLSARLLESTESTESLQRSAAAEKPAEQKKAPVFSFYVGIDRSESGGDKAGAEAYDAIVENPFFEPGKAPLSTFSIDVDTASYSNMRRFLASHQLPPRDSVRIEELVNYFDYEDPAPTDGRPFAVRLESAACPWAADHRLVRVSLKGKEIPKSERPPTNLVFLLDVSGSMRDENKLPLVRQAMKLLVGEMTEDDRIAIVTYAGNAGLVLDSTTGDKKDVIIKAIDNLQAAGSTNGEAGIHLAYSTAVAHLFPEGSNRVILCTDGDFNVGVSGDDELVNIIQDKARDSKVFLSVFGFGMGNLKDAKLEKLADKGNGHYAYVDNLREAKKVFVEGLTGTLYTIAKDVKLQIEFNPAKVGAYRLIGYENRVMPAEHFNDDTKDAGEIGAGHSVTALYELVPADKMTTVAKRPDLRYQAVPQPKEEPKPQVTHGDELLTVSLRFKHPDRNTSDKLEFPLADTPGQPSQGTRDMQWTTSVAAFGMLLRGSQFRGQSSFDMVLELAQAGRGEDKSGRRGEFIELAKTAKALYTPQPPVPPSTQPVEPKPPQ